MSYNRLAEFLFQAMDRVCPHKIAELPGIRSLDKEGWLFWHLCWFNILPGRFTKWVVENMKWDSPPIVIDSDPGFDHSNLERPYWSELLGPCICDHCKQLRKEGKT